MSGLFGNLPALGAAARSRDADSKADLERKLAEVAASDQHHGASGMGHMRDSNGADASGDEEDEEDEDEEGGAAWYENAEPVEQPTAGLQRRPRRREESEEEEEEEAEEVAPIASTSQQQQQHGVSETAHGAVAAEGKPAKRARFADVEVTARHEAPPAPQVGAGMCAAQCAHASHAAPAC